jgi:hypothetical protein
MFGIRPISWVPLEKNRIAFHFVWISLEILSYDMRGNLATEISTSSHFGLTDDLSAETKRRGQVRIALDFHDDVVDNHIDGVEMGNKCAKDA